MADMWHIEPREPKDEPGIAQTIDLKGEANGVGYSRRVILHSADGLFNPVDWDRAVKGFMVPPADFRALPDLLLWVLTPALVFQSVNAIAGLLLVSRYYLASFWLFVLVLLAAGIVLTRKVVTDGVILYRLLLIIGSIAFLCL